MFSVVCNSAWVHMHECENPPNKTFHSNHNLKLTLKIDSTCYFVSYNSNNHLKDYQLILQATMLILTNTLFRFFW